MPPFPSMPAGTHRLADAGVASQHIGVLNDGQVGRGGWSDLQDAAPLGKVSAILLVLGTAFRQAIQTCTGKRGVKGGCRRTQLLLLAPG